MTFNEYLNCSLNKFNIKVELSDPKRNLWTFDKLKMGFSPFFFKIKKAANILNFQIIGLKEPYISTNQLKYNPLPPLNGPAIEKKLFCGFP